MSGSVDASAVSPRTWLAWDTTASFLPGTFVQTARPCSLWKPLDGTSMTYVAWDGVVHADALLLVVGAARRPHGMPFFLVVHGQRLTWVEDDGGLVSC